MSKCWRCNKEFYNPYGNNTLCDECLGRQPKTTTINGFARRIFEEKLIPSHCLEQYEKYEKQIEEKDHRIKELEEQLKNAIVLPIPIGEKCWSINCWQEYGDAKKGEPYTITRYELHENTVSVYEIYKSMINNELALQIIPRCKTNYYGITSYVFATKEEALSKLRELQ